jgi:hypothetical protein
MESSRINFIKKTTLGVAAATAGIGAALSAARLGAGVLVIEATGCLGGMGTSGLVTAFDPMANGKEMLVGGIMQEIVTKLYQRGFLGPHEKPEIFMKEYHHWTPFQLEGYKLLLDELVTEAGIEVRFFTRVIEADADAKKGVLNGIIRFCKKPSKMDISAKSTAICRVYSS